MSFKIQPKVKWVLAVIILIMIISAIPKYLTTHSSWWSLNICAPNEIGDTIGGILGPIIGMIAALFAFLAFWEQLKTNSELKSNQLLDNFENRLFKLIELWNQTRGYSGFDEKVNQILNDFDSIYFALEQNYPNASEKTEKVYKTSFFLLYHGMIFKSNSGVNTNNRIRELLKKSGFNENEYYNSISSALNRLFINNTITSERGVGIESTFCRYFDSIYQIINYIDSQNILPSDAKFKYMEILKSQLSVNELYILYLFSISKINLNLKVRINNISELMAKYGIVEYLKKQYFVFPRRVL